MRGSREAGESLDFGELQKLAPDLGPGLFPLLGELRARPGLLLIDLAWRWGCGAFLLLLAGYQGWRVWQACTPPLAAAGAFSTTSDSLLEALGDPSPLLALVSAVWHILLPPAMRAVLGLLPLALASWVAAFTLGRGALLARYDPRLPSRPWLLAGCKGFAVLGGAAICGVWGLSIVESAKLLLQPADASPLLYALLLGFASWLAVWAWTLLSSKVQIALALGLLESLSTQDALLRSFQGPGERIAARAARFRTAARKTRFRMLWPAFFISLLPSPFLDHRALLVWYGVLSLVPLVATDAVKLAEQLMLLRELRAELDARMKAMPGVPLEKLRI